MLAVGIKKSSPVFLVTIPERLSVKTLLPVCVILYYRTPDASLNFRKLIQYHVNFTSVWRELNQRGKKKWFCTPQKGVLQFAVFLYRYFLRKSKNICESYTYDFLNTVLSILIFVKPCHIIYILEGLLGINKKSLTFSSVILLGVF